MFNWRYIYMYHNSLELGIRTYTLEKRGYVANIFGNFILIFI